MVTISECQSKKSLTLFERLPEQLHVNEPWYVPPFPGSISKLFKKEAVFNRRHGEMMPFIAYKDGVPAGRIAAIANRSHNEFYKDRTGFFGFFDCTNDPEVAAALFTKVRDWLKERNLTSLRGPYNPTVNDELGVLAEGFDSAPLVMMPYNPPYYIELYERAGLKVARTLLAYSISAEAKVPERIEKIVARVKRSTGLSFRNINMKRLPEELKIIQALYNRTLDRNWGFIPVTYEDLEFAAEDLKAIVDPNMVIIAEKNGVPVGFSLTFPDVNEWMFKARASKSPVMRALKFLWYLKTRNPSKARLAILGALPEYRNTGIAAVFYYETLNRAKGKYTGGEMSWIDEDNEEITKHILVMGGRSYKKYRIYEASIAGGAA